MDHMKKLIAQHPWASLSTITTFDLGDDTTALNEVEHNGFANRTDATTQLIRNIKLIGLLKAKASTPISLLVESLVQQLCSLLEPDKLKADQLYKVICEKLHEMKLIDESFSMDEFELMRSQYQKAFYHLVDVAKNSPVQLSRPPVIPTLNDSFEWSRYHREFIEMECIGQGGFGQVFKAKHRLDDTEYAIKKIYIQTDTVKAVMSNIEEVRAMASLNHNNVVPYKNAWMETIMCSEISTIVRSVHSTVSTSQSFSNLTETCEQSYRHQTDSLRLEHTDSSDFIEFAAEEAETNSREDCSNDKQLCVISGDEVDSISRNKAKTKWAILHIQMALCQLTLKDWLDARNRNEREMQVIRPNDFKKRTATIEDVFTQLVEGLEYIHSKHYVHHDIKPTNIFITQDVGKIRVQLGDFGLACHLKKTHVDVGQGTQLYAAPEQLKGKCDPKSDMFSLGIVLLELIESFNTDMERYRNISDLRKGRLGAHISLEHPHLAHIISQLVTNKPASRPDASEVLSQLTRTKELANANILAQQLREKDAEIERLRALLHKAGYPVE